MDHPDSEVVRLEKWRVVPAADDDKTAQAIHYRLSGKVYGHPEFEDGSKLTTSAIERIDGRFVYCKSRRYLLGAPSAEYFLDLHEAGVEMEESDPLKYLLIAKSNR